MLQKLFYATCLYIVLIAFHGYTFGENDQIEQLSYVKHLIDNSLYVNDFYVQSITKNVPNERFVVAYLLSLFGTEKLEWAIFILHYLFTLSLILGLFAIAKKFIRQEGWIWIGLLVLFIPFYKFNLGGNDLYYNELLSGNMSKAIGVWAFYYFLEKNHSKFVVLVILATLLHPLAGGQVFALAFGSYFFNAVFFEKTIFNNFDFKKHKSFIISGLVYILLAGSWLFLLLKNFTNSTVSNQDFFEIIKFRVSHHFFPSAFGSKNYVIVGGLFAWAMYYVWKKDKLVFGIFLTSILVAVFYTVLVEIFHSTLPFTTQWFKTTIWLKAFGVILLFAWLSERAFLQLITFFNFINVGKTLLLGLAMYCFFQIKSPEGRFLAKTYNLPFKIYQARNDIDISLKVKQLTDKKAVFLQPATMTCFKVFSERSSYFEPKANQQTKEGYKNWYALMQAIYGINAQNRDVSQSLFQQADTRFFQLKETDFQRFKTEFGVTHIVTKKNHVLNFAKIGENEEFVIYVLSL